MKFFKRKDDQNESEYEQGFDDAVELLGMEVYESLHLALRSIPQKKRGQRRGFTHALAVFGDVLDVYDTRDISAREFTARTKNYWKATLSFRDGDASISKEWNSLDN